MSFLFALAFRTLLCCAFLCVFSPVVWAQPESLRLCSEDWPPYEYHENGQPRGLAQEIIYAVLRNMDVSVERDDSVTWLRGLEAVRTGNMDMLYSAFKTPEREVYAYFPEEPLADSVWSLIVRKDGVSPVVFSGYASLRGKRLGLVRGYAYPDEFIKKVCGIAKCEVRTTSVENIRKLIGGRVDYAVEEVRVAKALAKQLGAEGKVVMVPDHVVVAQPIYSMFSKVTVSPLFVRQFSEELVRFKHTPEYEAILARYR